MYPKAAIFQNKVVVIVCHQLPNYRRVSRIDIVWIREGYFAFLIMRQFRFQQL